MVPYYQSTPFVHAFDCFAKLGMLAFPKRPNKMRFQTKIFNQQTYISEYKNCDLDESYATYMLKKYPIPMKTCASLSVLFKNIWEAGLRF